MRTATKIWLIIAASLVLIGCIVFAGVMGMLKWDFSQLSTNTYETNHHTVHEDFKNITIVADTAGIVFVPSENTEAAVICHEQKNVTHSVTIVDNSLVIEVVDSRKWYEHIGIHADTPKITVSVPQGEYGTLSINSSTGSIRVENISAGSLALSVSTGKVTASNVNCRDDIQVGVSTGKAYLTNISCRNLTSTGDTGSIILTHVIATGAMSVERSTGDVKLNGCDAAELLLVTDTGDITGSLLSEKVFLAHTDTGRINVPQTFTGGKCEIRTDTGDIKITIQ